MTIDTASAAKEILRKNNIDPIIYSVGPPKSTECVVIENIENIWCTYYWERGQKDPIVKHSTEADAVAYFLKKVLRVASLSSGKEIVLR